MTTPAKALERAVEIAGSQAELARRIGKTQAHVWNWLHRDKDLPAKQAIAIEQATNGEVTRHELRPDLYPDEPKKRPSDRRAVA